MAVSSRGLGIGLLAGIAGGIAWFTLRGAGDDLPPAVSDPRGAPLALAIDVPFEELIVPTESRGGVPVPVALEIPPDRWTHAGSNSRGSGVWTVPVPFRPRGLFFMTPQAGMALTWEDGSRVPYRLGSDRAVGPSWSHDRDELTLVLPDGAPPPTLRFAYPLASEREAGLNRDAAVAAGLVADSEGFARGATVQDGWTSRRGLLLPAPARAAFRVTLPEAPVFTLSPGLVRPELGDASLSDGAKLIVRVDDGSGPVDVFEQALVHGEFPLRRVDLSRWAEREVRVELVTEPGSNATFDYAFVGEPVISSRKVNPRRVVLVFVDTLRPDHLSLYGYERPTSPSLDAFAEGAAVFGNARSVAPWTLPSARTVVTGRQPEHYDTAPTLQALLAAEGFATAMFAGNVYLSANFGMSRDWGMHEVGKFDGRGWKSPPAGEVTDAALDWLDAHEGQDALVLVHYMNVHLPYQEPASERSRWAGDVPQGFPEQFTLQDVRSKGRGSPAIQTWVKDRYDQTVHWVDSELERLFASIDDNDVLVFFSDHGEEFWEHGGFEHGHTLYDELLRVPLVVRAPGLPPGRIDAPVSLLDLTPTVLDALGVAAPEMDGTSLLPVARGEAGAAEALGARRLAFGRPLYGSTGATEQWGLLDGSMKWTTERGSEELYDLAADAGEQTDLAEVRSGDLPRFRAGLGQTLDRPSDVGFRLAPGRGVVKTGPVVARVFVPGGIAHVWAGEDPLQNTDLVIRRIDPETVELTWSGVSSREGFVTPVRPASEVVHQMCVTLTQSGRTETHGVPASHPVRPGQPLIQASVRGGPVEVGWSMSPAPASGALALDATNDEMTEALEAIGYTDEEREPAPDAIEPTQTGSPCAPSPPG